MSDDKKNTKDTKKDNKAKASFTKEQILLSEKYANRKDLLSVILKEDKHYSFDDIDNEIDNFFRKGVM